MLSLFFKCLCTEPAVDPIMIDKRENITLIGLNRPQQRNAVNRDMARQLNVAFQAFEQDSQSNVAVLHGKGMGLLKIYINVS